MSAIFGIIHFTNLPIQHEDLHAMQEAMSYWGSDGQYLWCEGAAALGQLQLFNSTESVNEKFPLIDKERGLIFVSAARIDNRGELFHLLEIPSKHRNTITDAELAFASYKKWGKECVNHLLGDWSFAVWNSNSNELFIARDHHGITGIYYYFNHEFLVFASSLKGLLALPQVPKKMNELRIAQVLISWPGDGVQTAYLDILRLPPSNTLTVSNGKIEKTRYWYAENTKPLSYKNDNDYIDHFNELFTDAVQCRLRTHGQVGSTLSSGLDSSSVSAVAANLLKQNNRRLPVFTSVPLFDCQEQIQTLRLANEGFLASKLVAFNGNMDHYMLKAESISVLEGIEKMLWIHDQPFHAAANSYWIIDMMENVRKQGCNVLLTGQSGNSTISWPTSHYINRTLSPKRPIFSLQNLTHLNQFKKNILKPSIPTSLLNYYHKSLAGKRPWESHSALKRTFADKIQLKKQMEKAGFDPSFSKNKDIATIRFDILKPGKAIVGQQWNEIGAAFGIEVRDPTMDKRIIEFCVAVPDRIYIKGNSGRMLIREAMKGIIPNELLWNSKRGLQASDIKQRIQMDIEKWIGLTQNLNSNSIIHELLDINFIVNHLASINNNKQINNKSVNIVNKGSMAALWLAKFDLKT